MPEEDFDVFLTLLSQLLKLDPQQKSAIADELRDHLEERMLDLKDQGIPRKEAVRRALEEFGDAAGLASRFTSISHHRRRRILMRCTLATGVLAGVVFLAILLLGPSGPEGPPQQVAAQAPETPTAPPKSVEAPTTMPAVLLKEVDVEFVETPLADAAEFLSDQCKLGVILDDKALSEEGVARDEPITIDATKTPLYLVLNRMLKPRDLAWYYKNELLFITTKTEADDTLFTKYYPVQPLLDLGFSRQHIVELMQNLTTHPWMDVDGVGGEAFFIGRTLTVRQTFQAQVEIGDLLAALQKLDQPILRLEPKQHANLRQALASPVMVEFIDTPLCDAAAFLGDAAKVPFALDQAALEEEGLSADTPVNLTLKGQNLETTLELMLQPLDAEAVLENGTILITTKTEAEDKLATVIYNVKDIADTESALNQLTSAIYAVTVGPWLETEGIGGQMLTLNRGTLIVRQKEQDHQEIARLLANQRNSGGDVKLQPLPPQVTTKMYRMSADTAEDLLATLPEFVATNTWQTAACQECLGTIRKVATGQTFVKYPEATKPLKPQTPPQLRPGEQVPEETPEAQYIVVPQAVLIIRQTKEAHREIDTFLRNLLPVEYARSAARAAF